MPRATFRSAVAMVLIVAVGTTAAALLHQARSDLQEDRRDTAVVSQQTTAALVGQHLNQTIVEAQRLAARIDVSAGPRPARFLLRDLLISRTGHFNAAAELVALDGTRVTTYARRAPVAHAEHATFRAAFAAAAAGTPTISDLALVDGQPHVAVAVPTRRPAGPVDGVLIAYMHTPTSLLQRYSASSGTAGGTRGGIADRTGTLVTARGDARIGDDLGAVPRSRAGAADHVVDGVATVTVVAPVPGHGWALVQQQPADAFYGRAAEKSLQSELLMLAALIAGAAYSVWHLQARHSDQLRASARYRAVVADASDAIVVTDGAGTVTFTNPAITQLTGRPADAVVGTRLVDLVDAEEAGVLSSALADAAQGRDSRPQLRIVRADGVQRICDVTVSSPAAIDGTVVTFRDVTDLTDAIDQLAHQADHDHLTGLPNRAALARRLDEVLGAPGQRPAVLFIDLDGFKQVNDSHGHDIGDELLVAVAGRLSSCLRGEDTLSRQGGDEFVALLGGAVGRDAAAGVAERMIERLSEPFVTSTSVCHIGASIGIAFADDGSSADEVLRVADSLMYQAKQLGRGRYVAATLG